MGDPGAAESLPTLSLLCRCGPLGRRQPCDVRNVDGSQVCTACLPPACPAGLHPASSIALGAGPPLLPLPPPSPPHPPLPLNNPLSLPPSFLNALQGFLQLTSTSLTPETQAPLESWVGRPPAALGAPGATTWGCWLHPSKQRWLGVWQENMELAGCVCPSPFP